MTWLIFCSLAFCAFQIVFGDKLAEDISASIDTFSDPMTQAKAQTDADIWDVAVTVKSKEITSDQICNKCTKDDAGQKFDGIYETKLEKCQQCYDKAKTAKDIQNAGNCCKKIAGEFKEKDVKSFKIQAKKCIADLAQKCAKSATVCRQEATNADKVYDKWMEMQMKDARKYLSRRK